MKVIPAHRNQKSTNTNRNSQNLSRSIKTEEQFGDLFTVTIEAENLTDVYDRIKEVIEREETVTHAWLPSREKL